MLGKLHFLLLLLSSIEKGLSNRVPIRHLDGQSRHSSSYTVLSVLYYTVLYCTVCGVLGVAVVNREKWIPFS